MILHVDMDAFYASIEERERPELKGKPLIVGGSPLGRGVVSAANYAARNFGVHSAMPTSKAVRLCPALQIVRPRMSYYAQISQQIRDIFARYTPDVEPLSLDEAFLDVSGSAKLFGSAVEIGRRIQFSIFEELELVASVGVAPNKFLAKLASDLEKPNGFTVIPVERVQEIIDPLPISRIWGVGKVTQKRLDACGIATFRQLRLLGREQARLILGGVGEHFWLLSQGIDTRKVTPERVAKSLSHEMTFPVDVDDPQVLLVHLLELTEQVAERLRAKRIRGKTVQIKVRYSNFDTITRARSLRQPTHSTDLLWQVASDLLKWELPHRPLDVRLIGMGISNLETAGPVQLELFDQGASTVAAQSAQLDAATDRIREKFGRTALRRGSTFPGHESG